MAHEWPAHAFAACRRQELGEVPGADADRVVQQAGDTDAWRHLCNFRYL